MLRKSQLCRYLRVLLLSLVFFAGGCPPKVELLPICPGRQSAAEAISALRSRAEKAGPLRANGQCRIQFNTQNKKHPENFSIKLWVNPPAQFYLQGDVGFDARGVLVGSNSEEFWVWIRPKEISSYWWGRWSDGAQLERMVISPRMVLEGLGIASVDADDGQGAWSLSNRGPYDILTRRGEDGSVIKKLYVAACDYSVRKIEYFDASGKVSAFVELSGYTQAGEDFSIPAVIKITNRQAGGDDSARITLNPDSVKAMAFNRKQIDYLFTRPEPKGFKQVWMYIDGHWVEQRY
ncbi:MAG: hypothetical protein JSU94_02210 [Phycisphaerales bacterium]|nr:MAG: hypothetical protein JSU94_02210 [Phycisphaerales bacterium]